MWDIYIIQISSSVERDLNLCYPIFIKCALCYCDNATNVPIISFGSAELGSRSPQLLTSLH